MNKKSLVHLLEYDLSWSELEKLPEEHVAALSVLSFAVSEVNALARIYLSQSHEYVDQKPMDSAANIQRFVVIRSWSSKLFEAHQFLLFGGRKKQTNDPLLLELASTALNDFEDLEHQDGYQTARDVRNEAANHYSFNAAKKNLSSVHNRADCKFYIHENSGNCFFPLGEEVMFNARLNRRWEQITEKQERDAKFLEWLNWCVSANNWLQSVHAHFAKALLFDALGRNVLRKKTYWVPPAYTGSSPKRRTPVFLDPGNNK